MKEAIRTAMNFIFADCRFFFILSQKAIEWSEVVTEGKDLEDCRSMLRDALNEMILAYNELGKEMPLGNALIEQLPVEVEYVGQATWFNTLFGKEQFLPAQRRWQTFYLHKWQKGCSGKKAQTTR